MPPDIDRRLAPRRRPQSKDTLSRVRLRTGREMVVVDISSAGALVEGITRLLPGTHADVHIVTRHGRVLVRARVVRAMVCHLEADVIRYRAALAFDTPIDTEMDGYAVPALSEATPAGEGSPYPDALVTSQF
jgi:hypothetical protein